MAGSSKSPSKSPSRSPRSPVDQVATVIENAPIAAADAGDGDELVAEEWEATSLASDGSSVGGASTSVVSSLYQFAYENGRRFHQYKNARYPIPNDDLEQNRDDMKHAMMLELTNGKLFFSPVGDNPQKIIDLGTGTGLWAIEVADRFPSAEVIGIDQTPIQPDWVPPNLRFIIDDIEDDTWLHGSGYDLMHLRQVLPLVQKPEQVLANAYAHLRPGGWLEVQELGGLPRCDDDTMPADFGVQQFADRTQEAMARFGSDFQIGNRLQPLLEAAGFVNLTCRKLKVPVGPWAKDNTLRVVGMYFRLILRDFLGALAARSFVSLGMSREEIELFLVHVRKDLDNPNIHSYYEYFFWTAQKPEATEGA